MSRIRIIMLAALAVFAVSAVAVSSASAGPPPNCYRVAVAGTGNKEVGCAANTGATKNEYIEIVKLETELKPGEWCAKVAAGTGVYEDNKCTKVGGSKEFIKVVEGPHWWVIGCVKLVEPETGFYKDGKCNPKEATKTFKWEKFLTSHELLPGQTATTVSKNTTNFTLKSSLAGVKITIVCEKVEDKSTVEGGWPGTDINTVIFTKCKVTVPAEAAEKGCKVKEPIEVVNAKTILVFLIRTAAGAKWTKATEAEYEATATANRAIGDEFRPASGTLFTTVTIEGCLAPFTSLNGPHEVKGTDTGIAEGSLLKFTKETSNLTFGGNEATLEGTTEQEVEGGGKIEALK